MSPSPPPLPPPAFTTKAHGPPHHHHYLRYHQLGPELSMPHDLMTVPFVPPAHHLLDAFPCLQVVVHDGTVTIHHQPTLVGAISFQSQQSGPQPGSCPAAATASAASATTSTFAAPVPSYAPSRHASLSRSTSNAASGSGPGKPFQDLQLDYRALNVEDLLITAVRLLTAARLATLEGLLDPYVL
jgi:hypothetical protein